MESWGEYNSRQIFYLATREPNEWLEKLPNENWLALIIGNDNEIQLYSDLANICLEKNVLYVCTVGLACELIHDIFDEAYVSKKIDAGISVESEEFLKDSPMTSWHNNFEEGVWFAIIAANDGVKDINKVIFIDLTKDTIRQKLFELVGKIKEGYSPSDEIFIPPAT